MGTAKRGLDFLKVVAAFAAESDGHDKILKAFRVTGGGGGRCIGEFTVTNDMLNVNEKLHGGYTAAMIDNVTTYALMSANAHPGSTIDLKVSYLKGAKAGDEIIVDANTLKVGANLAYIECILKMKQDQSIVAKGGQTKLISFDKKPKNNNYNPKIK